MKKWNVLLIIATIFMCMIGLTGCSSQTIDFEQILIVDVSGLDGKGIVSTTINRDIVRSKAYLEDLYPDCSEEEAWDKFNDLIDTIDIEFSKRANLSNGDEITITVTCDKDICKRDDIEIDNAKFKITVAGLSEGNKIDVFDGLQVTYSGLSGKGYASFDNSECDDFTQEYVYFSCDESDLSNGDTIIVTAKYDQNAADENLYIVESDTKEFTVSGLKEPIEIDPFENLGITYTGASPYITASIDSSKCDSMVNQFIQFEIEDKYLRNGDTFTVTAVYNEYDAEEYGFIVKEDTKTYTVENQPEYVTSLDGLDLSALQAELDDKLAVFTAANEGDFSFADVPMGYFLSIAEKNYRTSYLVSLKTSFEDKFDDYNYNYNRYIQIYEYTVNEGNAGQKKAYVMVYANNIRKNSNGTIEWDIELGSKGYDNYDSLINDYVTSAKEYYNVSEITAGAEKSTQ